jgi:hypothetical protein
MDGQRRKQLHIPTNNLAGSSHPIARVRNLGYLLDALHIWAFHLLAYTQ